MGLRYCICGASEIIHDDDYPCRFIDERSAITYENFKAWAMTKSGYGELVTNMDVLVLVEVGRTRISYYQNNRKGFDNTPYVSVGDQGCFGMSCEFKGVSSMRDVMDLYRLIGAD